MRARLFLVLGVVAVAVLLQAQATPKTVSRAHVAYRPKSASESTDALTATPPELALKAVVQHNPNAHIPPQCYTKTVDDEGAVHNPCYTCHTESRAPNFINDADLQLSYNFAPHALKNAWTNLFIDWRPEIAGVTDDTILSYVRQSNYFDASGEIALAKKLRAVPKDWDYGDDGTWNGFIADAYFKLDSDGFDHAPDGKPTGWRAYAYYPVPGTFWPTNGSMGDALIRLPEAFRQTEAGAYDAAVYKLNLAILEASIKRADIAIDVADEAALKVDLDGDGKLARTKRVAFYEPVDDKKHMRFVGKARLEQDVGKIQLRPGLFPVGVELLHTVRYLDPTAHGVRLSPRLKELRYARKHSFFKNSGSSAAPPPKPNRSSTPHSSAAASAATSNKASTTAKAGASPASSKTRRVHYAHRASKRPCTAWAATAAPAQPTTACSPSAASSATKRPRTAGSTSTNTAWKAWRIERSQVVRA